MVPRKQLIIIAGLLWFLVGLMLMNLARIWLLDYRGNYSWVFISAGLLLAVIKYFLVFAKMADRNLDRLNKLGTRIPFYRLYTTSTYILIVVMTAAGILARKTALPRECLGSIDIAIGLGLVFATLRYFGKHFKGTAEGD